ncbi:MAG: 2-amino-4-hydroxy-6-hydroxymethyldihydropteridine diphosphokinase [Candidatus Margulisbacteria bacterium]|nr:2-amino-4-hydroxy-6-hydroxymethyldihydropteridine diphosphokinase [Candidatus Margulisiibacteriota bacterium]
MHKVFLGIGANLGDRQLTIDKTLEELEKDEHITIIATSGFLEYMAEKRPNEPKFLNGVVKILTGYTPLQLLQVTEEIERKLGRLYKGAYHPRTIDIDILLFDEEVILEDNLIIPHPLMHERIFVMEPLNEIAPEAYHPILSKNAATIYRALKEGRDI